MKKFSFCIIICILLTTCNDEPFNYPPLGDSDLVTEVDFYGPYRNITLRGLNKNDLFLVKVNTSTQFVDMTKTGGADDPHYFANIMAKFNEHSEPLIIGHPTATKYHSTPFYVPNNINLLRSPTSLSSSNTIGDNHDFWVESVLNNGDFIQREAILQAIGEHCKIWVVPNIDFKKTITRAQAQTLAQKFDIIYPAATNLIGYEFGGGTGGSGGRDSDPKIQILVYNIGGGTGGYFWAKDYQTQEQLNANANTSHLRTNNAEIFYICAEMVNTDMDSTYSTLIHEFQHMINWNNKRLKNYVTSKEWYDEMLSLMMEDVMSSLVGIAPSSRGHVQERIPDFLAYYFISGITEWLEDYYYGDNEDNKRDYYLLLYSYKYAYGAYLLRNYGGAALLREIATNNLVNEASITAALNKAYDSSVNFQYTLKRFGEALVYTRPLPEGVMTFDKTVSNTINGVTYTSYGFNIWNMNNSYPSMDYNMHKYFNSKGPFVASLEYWSSMPRHSIALFTHESWLNLTGDVTITLVRPEDPNIRFILMIK